MKLLPLLTVLWIARGDMGVEIDFELIPCNTEKDHQKGIYGR